MQFNGEQVVYMCSYVCVCHGQNSASYDNLLLCDASMWCSGCADIGTVDVSSLPQLSSVSP